MQCITTSLIFSPLLNYGLIVFVDYCYRGSQLAQFLTDGNPQGDVIKSVKELQEHDPKGLEKCWSLAQRYSKQLFEIYKNKEDPLFLPS